MAGARSPRIRRIQGTVWANAGADGPWYSVSLTCSYVDAAKQWKTAMTFGRDDLLTVGEVSRLCWHNVVQQAGGKIDGGTQDEVGGHGNHVPC